MKNILSTIAVSTALTVAFATPGLADNPMVGGAAMYENKNIVENAVNSADHTTLVAAVKAAGLGELDKRKIQITSAIKSVGEHEATVRLRDDVTAVITLQVVAAK